MDVPEMKLSGWQNMLAEKVVFVGFEQDFTYRLYDYEENKVHTAREVHFNEDECNDFYQPADYLDLRSLQTWFESWLGRD